MQANEAIIVFAATNRFSEELHGLVPMDRGYSNSVIWITPDQTYQSLAPDRYLINPDAPADYQQLFRDIVKQGKVPRYLIHLWNLETTANPVDDSEAMAAQLDLNLDRGLYSILYLYQAVYQEVYQKVTQLKLESKIKCLYLFPGSSRRVSPLHESLSGFANSHATVNHRFELILIQIAPDSGIQKELAGIILNETSDPANANGREIRYENGCRFIRTMQRFQPAGNLSLVPGGVYLITGGSGGLGMIFARYLAEHYRARLILTGRSPLEKDKLEQLKALENLGAEAAYIRTDISKLAEVKRLITMIRQKYRTIHGVIHSAGVSGGPLVGQSDKASFEKVLQPKVQGLINLDMALGEEKIDFLVMFSSIAAVVGDFGGCSYAVANSFMDRFARFREQLRLEGKRSGKTLSINWALWKEGGLGLGDSELRDYYFKYSGMQALETAWGIKAFRAAMAAEAVQVVVASGQGPGRAGPVDPGRPRRRCVLP